MTTVTRFPHELLARSCADRLAYFKTKTIAHPRLVETDDLAMRAIREPADAGLIVIYGPSGVGKTTLCQRICQQVTEEMLPELQQDPGRLPIGILEAVAGESGDFNWRDFYYRAQLALAEPLIDHKIGETHWRERRGASERVAVRRGAVVADLRHAFEQCLRHRRPRAFIVDEAQHLKKIASGRRLLDQLDTIKSIASLTRTLFVLIGTYELLALTNLSGQLNRRSVDLHFPRYQLSAPEDVAAFRRVLVTLQAHLPLDEPPDLVTPLEYCYQRSVGCVGVLKDWLTRTLASALERGARTITPRDLERHALSTPKLLQMAREITEGEQRLTDTAAQTAELNRLLGMEIVSARSTVVVPSEPVGKPVGRRAGRRVGERALARDPVGSSQRAG